MKIPARIAEWVKKPLTLQERAMNAIIGAIVGLVVGILISIATTPSPDDKPHGFALFTLAGATAGALSGFLAPRWLAAPVGFLLYLMSGA